MFDLVTGCCADVSVVMHGRTESLPFFFVPETKQHACPYKPDVGRVDVKFHLVSISLLGVSFEQLHGD